MTCAGAATGTCCSDDLRVVEGVEMCREHVRTSGWELLVQGRWFGSAIAIRR